MLEKLTADFDLTIFAAAAPTSQPSQKESSASEDDMSHVCIFQRFCVMMLLIRGSLEQRSSEETQQYLKQMNVYSEIRNLKATVQAHQSLL
jgi:hypothetical protein